MHLGFHEGLYWKVDHVLSPKLFYSALPCILEEGAVIYFSSFEKRDESAVFLDKHLVPSHLIECVILNASSEPALWSGHYLCTKAMQKDLECYFETWNSTIADNIVCYCRGELLLWFHDAFSGGELHLAGRFTKDDVTKFCAAMSPVFEQMSQQ